MVNSSIQIDKPLRNESGDYYHGYIDKVNAEDALEGLQSQYFTSLDFLSAIPEEKWSYAYAEGKWTIKELLVHIIDAERVFAYRALRVSRNDLTPIPGFDQDIYVPASRANDRTINSIIEEYKTVRQATYSLFDNMRPSDLTNRGTASGQVITPRAIAWIIIGHEKHHLDVIMDRYLD